MNPFRYGCVVDYEFFCPKRLFLGNYRFANPFFKAWL